jgi:hypothetical protein
MFGIFVIDKSDAFPNAPVSDVRQRKSRELQPARGARAVRRRDASGSQRSRRFRSEEAASEIDRSIQELNVSTRQGQ